jgi:uncharacterized protein (DUF2141 family)
MKLLYYTITSVILSSCAQFVPPTGGSIDKKPPTLISSVPVDKTTSYKGSIISLMFDELIDATSIRQELIITPQPKGTYNLKIKPYGIEIKYDESFSDNTTYTFNFRNGIKDLNEKNPAVNLKLVFSTGTSIDSLKISGNIKNLFSGLPSKEALVGLYSLNSKDTLHILNRKPDYFIQTDTAGNYKFENLRPSRYRILGFEDKNKNLIYDSITENFGFITDTINLEKNLTNINFDLYPNNSKPPKFTKTLSRQSNYSISLDKAIKSAEIQYIKLTDSLTYQIRGKEILFFNHPYTQDTILTKIIVKDSSYNNIEKEQKIYFNTTLRYLQKPELLVITNTTIKPNTYIKKIHKYIFNFQYPVTTIDTSKIKVISDTSNILPYEIIWLDRSQTQLQINFFNTAQTELSIIIKEGAITNYKLDSNSTYQLINKLYQQKDYASIDGSYNNFLGTKIIEILDSKTNEVVESQIFTDKYYFPELLPGTYKIRIIEDTNANGIWDTANFDKNELPERVLISKGYLKLKSNFSLSNLTIE